MERYLLIMMKELTINKNRNNLFDLKTLRFRTNPISLVFKKDLESNTESSYSIDSVFTVFNAFDGNTYLASSDFTSFTIKILNIKDKTSQQLKGHQLHIYIVRHFSHQSDMIDYLISSSCERCIKVWNLLSFTCQITIESCQNSIYIYSALLLFDVNENENYIITSAPNEYMKMYNFTSGALIKEIGMNIDYTYHIDIWRTFNESYIVNANNFNVKIYNLKDKDVVYKQFTTKEPEWHMSAFVDKIKGVYYLFETSSKGWL